MPRLPGNTSPICFSSRKISSCRISTRPKTFKPLVYIMPDVSLKLNPAKTNLRSVPRAARRTTHEGSLLLRSQLEHIANQQIRMIPRVPLEACRQRARKYPVIPFTLEQARRQWRSRNDERRVGNPSFGPGRLQTVFRVQEVWSDCTFIVRGVTGCVALQARCSRAGKQLPRHIFFSCRDGRELLRNKRLRLAGHGLKE